MATSPAVATLTALCADQSTHYDAASWLYARRQDAATEFIQHGFPTRKAEGWKYTNIDSLAQLSLTPTADAIDEHDGVNPTRTSVLEQVPAYRIEVFADGTPSAWSVQAQLPQGVTLTAIDTPQLNPNAAVESDVAHIAPTQGQPFVALNTALFAHGVQIVVAPNTILHKPLHLVYRTQAAASGNASFPRLFLHVGRAAQLTLLESHVGVGTQQHLCAAVSEILLQRHARLEHVMLHEADTLAYRIATTSVRQLGESLYRAHVLALGAALTRQEVHTALTEPGAQVELYGLHLGKDNDQIDAQTTIDHQAPQCHSREHYRSIVDGHASSVFNGRVLVQAGAKGSDAKQSNHNLLLADAATAYSKPQLEIFADDVKCAHGATVSQLDAEAVHYLCSRGIAAADARTMLIFGFADEVLRAVEDEASRNAIRDLVRAWLKAI